MRDPEGLRSLGMFLCMIGDKFLATFCTLRWFSFDTRSDFGILLFMETGIFVALDGILPFGAVTGRLLVFDGGLE